MRAGEAGRPGHALADRRVSWLEDCPSPAPLLPSTMPARLSSRVPCSQRTSIPSPLLLPIELGPPPPCAIVSCWLNLRGGVPRSRRRRSVDAEGVSMLASPPAQVGKRSVPVKPRDEPASLSVPCGGLLPRRALATTPAPTTPADKGRCFANSHSPATDRRRCRRRRRRRLR